MAKIQQRNGVILSPVFIIITIILLPVVGFVFGNKFTLQLNDRTSSSPGENKTSSSYKSLEDKVKESKSFGFRILTPQEGEILCRGQYYDIKWEAPSDVKVIDLYIRQAGAPPASTYDLGTFPSNYEDGKFSWKVGFNKGILWQPDGGEKKLLSRPGYEIQISSPDKNFIDFSGLFTITDCK